MDKKYLMKNNLKVAQTARIIAKAVDLFIALVFGFVLYPWGVVLGLIYIAICDSLPGGQSFGKRFMGIAVYSLNDGCPCSAKQSFIRNLPFLVPLFFLIIPLWGWIFSALFGLVLTLIELYLLVRLDSGHRLGDVMADTTVVPLNYGRINAQKSKMSWFENNSSVCIRSEKG